MQNMHKALEGLLAHGDSRRWCTRTKPASGGAAGLMGMPHTQINARVSSEIRPSQTRAASVNLGRCIDS